MGLECFLRWRLELLSRLHSYDTTGMIENVVPLSVCYHASISKAFIFFLRGTMMRLKRACLKRSYHKHFAHVQPRDPSFSHSGRPVSVAVARTPSFVDALARAHTHTHTHTHTHIMSGVRLSRARPACCVSIDTDAGYMCRNSEERSPTPAAGTAHQYTFPSARCTCSQFCNLRHRSVSVKGQGSRSTKAERKEGIQ